MGRWCVNAIHPNVGMLLELSSQSLGFALFIDSRTYHSDMVEVPKVSLVVEGVKYMGEKITKKER